MKIVIIVTALLVLTAAVVYAAEGAVGSDTAAVVPEESAADTDVVDTTAAATAVDTVRATAAAVDGDTAAVETTTAAVIASEESEAAVLPAAEQMGALRKREPSRVGYLLSLRPEFVLVHEEIYSIGGIAEVGLIFGNGLLLSADIAGGARYMGGGLNVGYFFGSRGAGVKCAFGYSFGYHNTDIAVRFENTDGDLLKRYIGRNVGVTGLFLKIAGGNRHLVDFTGRVMTGYKSRSVWYNEEDGVYSENGFSVSYSGSLGYTFAKRRGRR